MDHKNKPSIEVIAQEMNKSSFRSILATGLWRAHCFTGREADEEKLFDALIAVEYAMKLALGQERPGRVGETEENAVLKWAECRSDRTIDALLTLASERYLSAIRNLTAQKIDEVLLPPGYNGEIGQGNDTGIEKRREMLRYEEIMQWLRGKGIYVDDVMMIEGDKPVGQMRQHGYRLLEIPRINRQILVCDEVGESTYVVCNLMNRRLFFIYTKEELLEKFPEFIQQIPWRDRRKFFERLQELLFSDNPIRVKVDLPLREKYLQEISRMTPTAEGWGEMTQQQKIKYKIYGKGLNALATIFGVQGNPVGNHLIHIELGLKIYGEENEYLQNALKVERGDLDFIRQEISRMTPTVEEWGGMTQRQKEKYKIYGKGLNALATIFGVQGNPVGNHLIHIIHLELGLKIYGEQNEYFQNALKVERGDLDFIRQEISRMTPTVEEWGGMTQRQKIKYQIYGKGLNALATIFGVQGNPINHHLIHIELGLKIYGEENEYLQNALKVERGDLDFIRQEISRMTLTAEGWGEMTQQQKIKYQIYGKGLRALATIFGVQGDPVYYHSIHLELGRVIYGQIE